jgi:hypothetical protein
VKIKNSTSKAHIDPIVFPRHSLSTPPLSFPPLSREVSGRIEGEKEEQETPDLIALSRKQNKPTKHHHNLRLL